MYLLPWHSLSKTGSHLSTSIRWYSMGQPLSLAMIISDVTSCPEMVPYAGSMKSDRGSTSQGSGCNAQPVLEGSLFPLWSLPLSSFAANTNRHGWNSGECSSFCISPLSRIDRTFLCSGSSTFVNSGLSNGFWDKIENVRPNTFASNYSAIDCFGFGFFKFNLIRILTLFDSN